MAVKISAKYIGDDRVELRHGPSGEKILTDLPPDNGGKGRAFSPTDLFASSLAACILTIMAKAAAKDGLDISGASMEIEKHMQENPRRVGRFAGVINLPAGLSDKEKAKLEACVKVCPVTKSLHPDIKIEFKVE